MSDLEHLIGILESTDLDGWDIESRGPNECDCKIQFDGKNYIQLGMTSRESLHLIVNGHHANWDQPGLLSRAKGVLRKIKQQSSSREINKVINLLQEGA